MYHTTLGVVPTDGNGGCTTLFSSAAESAHEAANKPAARQMLRFFSILTLKNDNQAITLCSHLEVKSKLLNSHSK